ncbi:MAG TPA: hypothetical protein VM491_02410 [Burkholderiaceae bacterium]|nr:hypothetical protein [Burkholderiaceae bacterium]
MQTIEQASAAGATAAHRLMLALLISAQCQRQPEPSRAATVLIEHLRRALGELDHALAADDAPAAAVFMAAAHSELGHLLNATIAALALMQPTEH